MNRVEAAIREGRCVLAIGGRAMQNSDVISELRRRAVPAVALGADPVNPVMAMSADAVAPVLAQPGGMVVLVEPDAASDGRALGELDRLLAGGPNKPRLFVAAKAFNPFALPMAMRLLKMEQIKARAQDFLSALPVDLQPAVTVVEAERPAPESPADRRKGNAPRADFVGREDELATLGGMLSETGGPIVVHGPSGIGKRWLVEKAVADSGLHRLPDLTLGRGTGADTLLARIAMAARLVGDMRLHDALKPSDARPDPRQLSELVVDALNADGMESKAWVVHGLHTLLDNRDGSLYREGRLEMVLRALLTVETKLRLVFVSLSRPTFYAEGEAASLRSLALEGLKGRDLHQLFEAWHAPEFPRDRFGPIAERTHGHAFTNAMLAAAVRDDGDIEALLEQPRFLRSKDLSDLEALGRHLKRRVEKLDAALRFKLATASLLCDPATLEDLQAIEFSRNERLELLAGGLLCQTPGDDNRRYYVHPLVSEHLDYREVYDFASMEKLGGHLIARGNDARRGESLLEALAFYQEGNRLFVDARRGRDRAGVPYPDSDPLIDNIRSLMRRKKPRLDIARTRINEVLKLDPTCPELLLADAELRTLEKAGVENIGAAYSLAAETAPTPEVFHQECTWHLDRGSRGKAVAALERGAELFPDNARMLRRLAGLQSRQNNLEGAAETLRKAMDLEPMMPDTYAMLGELLTSMGPEHWERAAELIAEALRLDPENAGILVREVGLLHARGMADSENRDALWTMAEEKAKLAVNNAPNDARAKVALGKLLLDRIVPDEQEDRINQAEWLLGKALKASETPDALVQRARVYIRRGAFPDAERMLDKAIKKAPSTHEAFAAKGEAAFYDNNPFAALEHYKTARERSPKDAPERIGYEAVIEQIGALIASGHVSEFMAGSEEHAEPPATGVGERREPGSTTIRRKRQRRGKGSAQVDDGTQLDDGPTAPGPQAEPEAAAAEPEAAVPEPVPEPEAAVPEPVPEPEAAAPTEPEASEPVPEPEAPATEPEAPAAEPGPDDDTPEAAPKQ